MTDRFYATGRTVMQAEPAVMVAICVNDVWAKAIAALLVDSNAQFRPIDPLAERQYRGELRATRALPETTVTFDVPSPPATDEQPPPAILGAAMAMIAKGYGGDAHAGFQPDPDAWCGGCGLPTATASANCPLPDCPANPDGHDARRVELSPLALVLRCCGLCGWEGETDRGDCPECATRLTCRPA